MKVIYCFQLLGGTDVADGWTQLQRVRNTVWNFAAGILQADEADGEGFSNEDGCDRIPLMVLDLKPEIEARLAEQAAAHRLTVEAYVEYILESLAAECLSNERERSALVQEWLGSHPRMDPAPTFTPRIVGEAAPAKDRTKEHAWVAAHRDEYADQWVALDGDRLLGHGSNLKEVADAARDAGVKDALIARVEPCRTPPYVGI